MHGGEQADRYGEEDWVDLDVCLYRTEAKEQPRIFQTVMQFTDPRKQSKEI